MAATAMFYVGVSPCANAASMQAARLQARYAALEPQLAHNQFGRPLVLDSTQTSGALKGEIYAVVDHPFVKVSQALKDPDHWCDILMLHLNVKACVPQLAAKPATLTVNMGTKNDQPLDQTFKVVFDYQTVTDAPDELQIALNAADGPLGTHDYNVALDVVPLDAKRSFIHLAYSYSYGFAARFAMEGYLATVGHSKVGFTVTSTSADGKPVYVGGVRGVVERNTMRYYLAIETYLDTSGLPPDQQVEQRFSNWFTATEAYPLQLHEMERADYMAMKRTELHR